MTETVKQRRRRTMQAVKSENTKPEWVIRRLLHAAGYRYRLHVKDLPGKPDLVFPGRSKVIFVHGCFWHGHYCERGDRLPKTNAKYWATKIERNKARDRRHIAKLRRQGWKVRVVWECEIKKPATPGRLKRFLNGTDARNH